MRSCPWVGTTCILLSLSIVLYVIAIAMWVIGAEEVSKFFAYFAFPLLSLAVPWGEGARKVPQFLMVLAALLLVAITVIAAYITAQIIVVTYASRAGVAVCGVALDLWEIAPLFVQFFCHFGGALYMLSVVLAVVGMQVSRTVADPRIHGAVLWLLVSDFVTELYGALWQGLVEETAILPVQIALAVWVGVLLAFHLVGHTRVQGTIENTCMKGNTEVEPAPEEPEAKVQELPASEPRNWRMVAIVAGVLVAVTVLVTGSSAASAHVACATCDQFIADARNAGNGYLDYQGRAYKAFDEPRAFSRADETCAQDGGRLASIDGRSEARFQRCMDPASPRLWIGLRRPEGSSSQEAFSWVDGSDSSYERWAPETTRIAGAGSRAGAPIIPRNASTTTMPSPPECASVDRKQEWHETYCNVKLPFVCERKA